MGGISQQAFSPDPQAVAREGQAAYGVRRRDSSASSRTLTLPHVASAIALPVFLDHDGSSRNDRIGSAARNSWRPSPSKSQADIFCILQQARLQRALSTAAFSLHRPGPNENAVTTDGMPVRISDVRATQKKSRQCPQPRRCPDRDLRFSFPRIGRFLHFLFQSARIGLGRSVKED